MLLPSQPVTRISPPFWANQTRNTQPARKQRLTAKPIKPEPCNAHLHASTPALILLDTREQEGRESSESGSGSVPYWMRGIVVAEREERHEMGITPKDYGRRWRASFRDITGDAPMCAPGDRESARKYYQRVCEAIRKREWSPAEWNQLYRAERIWKARMNGKDARFEVMGTRPGRATFQEREKMRQVEMVISVGKIARPVRVRAMSAGI